MVCPNCQSINITCVGKSPNAGLLYVGEDFPEGSEVYAGEVEAYTCNNCDCAFYVEP